MRQITNTHTQTHTGRQRILEKCNLLHMTRDESYVWHQVSARMPGVILLRLILCLHLQQTIKFIKINWPCRHSPCAEWLTRYFNNHPRLDCPPRNELAGGGMSKLCGGMSETCQTIVLNICVDCPYVWVNAFAITWTHTLHFVHKQRVKCYV